MSQERTELSITRPVDPVAHEFYLKGTLLLEQKNRAGLGEEYRVF